MTRRAVLQTVRKIWVTLGLTALVVFTTWSLVAYRSSAEARRATESDAVVTVRHEKGAWFFQPASDSAIRNASLLFFAGALVDPRAYAPLARAAAAAGYPAVIKELPRRGAFGGADDPQLVRDAETLLRANRRTNWVVAGHSRGAVVASNLASLSSSIMGLALIGTSHPRDVDLSQLRVPVLKLAGTRDGLASPDEVKANASKLPPNTRWIWIEGGNHSQFGWYGFQPGDKTARIPRADQQRQMTEAVLGFLAEVATLTQPARIGWP